MRVQATLRRARAARLTPAQRAGARRSLAAGLAGLAARDLGAARSALEAAHDAARSSAALHTGAHLGLLSVALLEGGLQRARPEWGPLLLAAPSAWVRRAAGVAPGAPPAGSLRATWAARPMQ